MKKDGCNNTVSLLILNRNKVLFFKEFNHFRPLIYMFFLGKNQRLRLIIRFNSVFLSIVRCFIIHFPTFLYLTHCPFFSIIVLINLPFVEIMFTTFSNFQTGFLYIQISLRDYSETGLYFKNTLKKRLIVKSVLKKSYSYSDQYDQILILVMPNHQTKISMNQSKN